MQKFVNEYEYRTEYMEETLKGWMNRRYITPVNRILCMPLLVLGILLVFLKPDEEGRKLGFYVAGLAVFILLAPFLSERRSLKIQKQRLQTMYQNRELHVRYEAEGERCSCRIAENENENILSLSETEDHFETDHFLVLSLKGRLMIPMKKDCFLPEGGQEEDFRKFMEQFPRKRNMTGIILNTVLVFIIFCVLAGLIFSYLPADIFL